MQGANKHLSDSEDFSDYCVLLVEDEDILRLSLEDRLRLEGIPVKTSADITNAHTQLESGDIDLVVTDIRLPDGSGMDLFKDVSRYFPGTPVILMTAYSNVPDVVDLIKAGAVDYLTKPFDIDVFMEKVRNHLSRISDISLSSGPLVSSGSSFRPGSGVLGKSPAMRMIERLAARLAESDSSVLITGESGVGKEVVTDLIHHNSQRSDKPIIKVNCAALPHGLVESELFGHEKGAFTGATQRHIGRFEQAQGGTIFLDEIAEIPPETQVKLLRVVQENTVERVGGHGSIPLDVRVIAATQVDLEESMRKGDFRSDLYWRLNVIKVHVPPLRERKEDILYLARMFVNEFAENKRSTVKGLSKSAESRLVSMEFPGNVRELRNIIEGAVALCDGTWIGESDFLAQGNAISMDKQGEPTDTLKESVIKAEYHAILKALDENDWAINKAADSLGISRKSLWEKMKKYAIKNV